MVNNPNPRLLVFGNCQVRLAADGRQKIENGPVYDLAVLQLVAKTCGIRVINDKAVDDMAHEFDPAMLDDELVALVAALKPLHCIGSERCATSVGMTVDADEFAIEWNRARECESTRSGFGVMVYLKLGMSVAGKLCLVLSLHKSRR